MRLARLLAAAILGGTASHAQGPVVAPGGVKLVQTIKITVAIAKKGSVRFGNRTCVNPSNNQGVSCDWLVLKGNPVKLAAEPGEGNVLDGWTGPCQGQSSICTFTASANTVTAATFRPKVVPVLCG